MTAAHYAGPVDGAHTRDLLAGNAASARQARAAARIEDNYSVTVCGDELCYTLVGDTTPAVYVAAVFGADGEISAVAREGFYDVRECDLRAFEAAAMKRAWRNAERRSALADYEATMPERQARLAACTAHKAEAAEACRQDRAGVPVSLMEATR